MRIYFRRALFAGVLVLSSCGEGSKEDSGSKSSSAVDQSETSDPSLSEMANKVIYLGDYSDRWLVLFGFETKGLWLPNLVDGEGKTVNRRAFDEPLAPGDLFFKDAPMKERFEFVRIEERKEMNHRLNIEVILRYAIFKDQENGEIYEVPNRLPKALRGDYYHSDGKALLSLRGEGADQEPVMVAEGSRFGVPFEGSEKAFFLKLVSPQSIVIEWEDAGETRSKIIEVDYSASSFSSAVQEPIEDAE